VSLEELKAKLKEVFELNTYETSVYLTLLKKGMRADEISRNSRVPRPRVYDTLESLKSKGFVYEKDDVYYAVHPALALSSRVALLKAEFEEKQRKMSEAVNEIVSFLNLTQTSEPKGPFVLHGIASILSLLLKVFPESHKIFLTLNKALDSEARRVFRSVISGLSIKEKKELRVLIPYSVKLEAEDFELITLFGAQVRTIRGFLLDMMITDKDDVIIGLPDPLSTERLPVVAVYLKDHSFASSLFRSMEETWKIAEEL
jgi:sugar-specific transcriptional regulator TrmB